MGLAVGQLLITGVPLAMVKVTFWLVLPILFDAVSVAALVPAAVGVPLIRPLVAMFSPVGRLDPPKIIGAVPLAVTVLLNTTPTVPLKELVEVNCGDTPVGLLSAAELATRKPVIAISSEGSLGARMLAAEAPIE